MAPAAPFESSDLVHNDGSLSDELTLVLRLLPTLGLAHDAVFLRDQDSVITYWSTGAEQLYGWSAQEAVGHVSHELLGTEFPALRLPIDVLLVQDGRWEGELIHQRRDGRRVVVESRQVALRGNAGRLLGFLETNRDITQLRRTELVRYELAAIVESSQDAIIGKTLDAIITSWNQGAERLYGYTAAEVIGRPIAILIPPDRPDELPGIMARLRRGERVEHYDTERIAKDGRRLHISLTVSPIRDPSGQIVGASAVARDITERVQMQHALQDRETRMRFLAETSAALASSLDYETTLTQVTRLLVPAFADRCVIDLLGEDGRLQRVAGFQGDPEGNAVLQELLHRYPLDPDGAHPAAEAMRRGQVVSAADPPDTLLVAMAQDAEHLELLCRLSMYSYMAVPLIARGRVLGVMSFYRADPSLAYEADDIPFAEDLVRRAALAVDNARLYRDAQAALHLRDEFLSAISHDLRTPLTSIVGLTQLARRQLRRLGTPETEHIGGMLGNAERAMGTMTAMIDQLLDLSRLQSGRPLELHREPVDLLALVTQLVQDHQRGTNFHQIAVLSAVSQLRGMWDGLRLERVLSNLLSNAIKYSPNGDDIRVTVRRERAAADGHDWAVVEVEDHGIGIPAEELPFIFERFHRASNVPRRTPGVGIGLSGARQIAEQHGGTLTATSQEGHGACFMLRLPLNTDGVEAG